MKHKQHVEEKKNKLDMKLSSKQYKQVFTIDRDKGYAIQRNASFTICIIQIHIFILIFTLRHFNIKCIIDRDISMNSMLLSHHSYLK